MWCLKYFNDHCLNRKILPFINNNTVINIRKLSSIQCYHLINVSVSDSSMFFLLVFFFLIYWRIIAILVSAIHQHESAMGIHMSPRSWTPSPSRIPSHPSRLSQSAGLNSLCPTGICYPRGNICFHAALSIRPTLSFPHGVHKSAFCLCLHCSPANRFISNIFLDSAHMY